MPLLHNSKPKVIVVYHLSSISSQLSKLYILPKLLPHIFNETQGANSLIPLYTHHRHGPLFDVSIYEVNRIIILGESNLISSFIWTTDPYFTEIGKN